MKEIGASPERWTRIDSRQVADCRVFTVREDRSRRTDGTEATFYVIESPSWVNIIALTRNREVVLIRQYRHGSESVVLEIPGGMIDGSESPESAARRELLEETGYSSESWQELGTSLPNPAIQNNSVYHYLALNCERTADVSFDEHENIVTELMPVSDVHEAIERGDITHSLVIAAFYYFGSRQQKNESILI